MRALLMGCALASAMAIACSEVRVVDDDDGGTDDGAGGAVSGLGGGGGGPGNQPVNARLFAAGWLSGDDGAATGVEIWNDPEQGISRPGDVRMPIKSARDLAIVGDRLCVLAEDKLLIYADLWDLGDDAQPIAVIDKNQSGQQQPLMRALEGLDMVWADYRLYAGISNIQSGADAIEVPWHDPVYDPVADRLFVVLGDTIQVIDNASQSTSFEADFTLYEGDAGVNRLTTDGVLLYAARSGSGGSSSDWKIATWPLTVAGPTQPDALNAGPPGEIQALHPIPSGGVVAAAEHSLYTWAIAPGDPQDPTAYLLTPDETWRSGAVSQSNRIYSAGSPITVFADPALGEPVDQAPHDASGLALIER